MRGRATAAIFGLVKPAPNRFPRPCGAVAPALCAGQRLEASGAQVPSISLSTGQPSRAEPARLADTPQNRLGDGGNSGVDPGTRDALLAAVPSLRAFAISLTSNIDRADDLVQDTILRAWSHFDHFQPGT